MSAFKGAIIVKECQSSDNRAFSFDTTFYLDHPRLIKVASGEKPPLHFHPYQEEYIEVTEGELAVEVEGREYILTPSDGEFLIRPWTNHRLYPVMPTAGSDGPRKSRFLLSGEDTKDAFKLDKVFFQNWYAYQDEIVVRGKKVDLIQVMNMFDAGGSYLSLPAWVPFRNRLAQIMGIVVGRWIGGLLGYQPFHREWTSDWDAACAKMETSPFLRRFADRIKKD
ncbi:hypothetical protein M011DRAFT_449808, partial [Sporormia fimetaria CBS 119925]